MSNPVRRLLAEAMELDHVDRALVASELIASLDGPADPDAEVAWAIEIDRRVAGIESGEADLVDWSEVRARIQRNILQR